MKHLLEVDTDGERAEDREAEFRDLGLQLMELNHRRAGDPADPIRGGFNVIQVRQVA